MFEAILLGLAALSLWFCWRTSRALAEIEAADRARREAEYPSGWDWPREPDGDRPEAP